MKNYETFDRIAPVALFFFLVVMLMLTGCSDRDRQGASGPCVDSVQVVPGGKVFVVPAPCPSPEPTPAPSPSPCPRPRHKH